MWSSWVLVALATVASPVRVALDVQNVGANAFHAFELGGIYRELLVRITDEGMAVVVPDVAHDILLKIVAHGDAQIALTATAGSMHRTEFITLGDEPTASLRMTIAHRCLSMLRNVHAALLLGSGGAQTVADYALPASSDSRPRLVEFSGAGGVLRAGSHWSALVSGSLGLPLGRLGVVISAAYAPALGMPGPLEVSEWSVRAGVSLALVELIGPLSVQVALAGGRIHHRYRYRPAPGAAPQTGSRGDVLLVLEGKAGLDLTPSVHAYLGIEVWAAGRARVHHDGTNRLWRGDRLRPAVVLGFSGG